MRKYLIFNLIGFFLWGYTSYWDMTFNYKTNLSIQDSIFHSCTFIPLLWFIEVKNIKNTSFKNPQESATSLFYLLTHKYLLQNNLQIHKMYLICISNCCNRYYVINDLTCSCYKVHSGLSYRSILKSQTSCREFLISPSRDYRIYIFGQDI